MPYSSHLILFAALGALACGCAGPGADAAAVDAGANMASDDASVRLGQLEDREQIRQLLVDYGASLDRRDFAAFGALFAGNAEYVAGGPPARGRSAIQAQLERIIGSNPSNLPGPNFHLSFNPAIQLDGDSAMATSLGAYTAPDAAGSATRLVFFVWYQDDLVREEGRWKFQRRVVGSGPLPSPLATSPASMPAAGAAAMQSTAQR